MERSSTLEGAAASGLAASDGQDYALSNENDGVRHCVQLLIQGFGLFASLVVNKHGPLTKKNLQIYDGYSVPMDESRIRRVLDLLRKEREGTVLDVGCASGEFGEILMRSGWKVYGLDISAGNVLTARGRGIEAFVADLANGLPLNTESMNVVVAMEILEHLVDTELFLRECWRVLQPGGCLLLTTPNLARLENRIRLSLGLYPHWMDFQLEGGAGHVRYYTSSVLVRQLQAIGFEVRNITGTVLGLPLISRFRFFYEAMLPIFELAGRRFPSFASNLVVKAMKRETNPVTG